MTTLEPGGLITRFGRLAALSWRSQTGGQVIAAPGIHLLQIQPDGSGGGSGLRIARDNVDLVIPVGAVLKLADNQIDTSSVTPRRSADWRRYWSISRCPSWVAAQSMGTEPTNPDIQYQSS